MFAHLIRWGYYGFACVSPSVLCEPMRHNKRESHNAYNWRAISIPSERFGSNLSKLLIEQKQFVKKF